MLIVLFHVIVNNLLAKMYQVLIVSSVACIRSGL